MKRLFFSILVCTLVFAGCSCITEGNDKRVVAKINKYNMTVDDLKYELRNIPYDEIELLEEGRGKEYLDRLIEKEILLQEAQRLGLDREKDFMKSIESYWEQTLLRLLLEIKSKEISGIVHVYDNEIEEYYRDSGERLPFSRAKRDMERALRQKKETEAMNAWIDELREGASIKINDELLEEMLSERK